MEPSADKVTGGMTHTSWLARRIRGLLAIPLWIKVVMANAVAVLTAAALGTLTSPPRGPEILLLLILVAGCNTLLVQLALYPLRQLETTARAIEGGQIQVRIPPSPLADRELRRVVNVFNGMLDGLALSQGRDREAAFRILDFAEDDRSRSARDLLDDVAQTLSALQLRLLLLERSATPGFLIDLETLRGGIHSTLEQVHAIAIRLSPPELEHLTLDEALRAEARRLAQGTEVRIHVTGGLETDNQVVSAKRAICRLSNRLLRWAARRPGSGGLQLRLHQEGDLLVLDLSGVAQGDIATRTDNELLDLMDHARLLGGTLRTCGCEGGGLDLCMRLPLSPPESLPSGLAGPRPWESASGRTRTEG